MLLHCGGYDIQDIFYAIPDADTVAANEDPYKKTKEVLTNYFKPKINTTIERHKFRKVRRRALEKGDVTLEKVLEIAQALEATSIRLKGMEETETVAKISQKESKRKPAKKNDKKDNNCYRCEYKGHQQWEERCPARGKKCDNCNAIGHFAKMCKTKTAGNEKKKGGRNWERRNSEKKDRIQLTEETRGFEGICIWTDRKGCSMCNSREDCGGAGEKIVVRGVPLEVVVDSGASCNVIDEDTWKMCKIKNIKCDSRKTNKEIFAYAQNSKLELIGEFTSKTKVGRKEVMADFIVIKGKGKALIGYETACPTPWVSPIVPIEKKNNDVRICVDMRQTNRAIVRERFSLPIIEEILDKVKGSQWFSTLDIKDAYHQIELEEKSREITTFVTDEESGCRPIESKVVAIEKFRAPKTPEKVRSFLGLVNFCAAFIPNLATINEPLRKLTRKGIKFEWGKAQEIAFKELKEKLMNVKSLGIFDGKAQTRVIADASPVAIGMVLTQKGINGWKVIRYASRISSLSLVHELSVGSYDYNHISIKSYMRKGVTDPLSRLVVEREGVISGNMSSEEFYIQWLAKEAVPHAMNIEEIEKESKEDPILEQVRKALVTNDWKMLTSFRFRLLQNELYMSKITG
ncbi:hypothetical protein RF55_16716 [Lasius niger]|uniref:CCHC-type domain-containing protein n=1 Tax=Lasius niger TaxID=67767 RepID=A0A0J7K3Y9_LASNI|nr:hypothetical protein RF55_16716 [Lasius niger]